MIGEQLTVRLERDTIAYPVQPGDRNVLIVDNPTDTCFLCGVDHMIEYKDAERWKVPPIKAGRKGLIVSPAIGIDIGAGCRKQFTINYLQGEYELKPGRYRVKKTFIVPGLERKTVRYAEFIIK